MSASESSGVIDGQKPGPAVSRREFRGHFQPSRVVIALFPAPNASSVNPVTICYLMHSSHRPRSITVGIEVVNTSNALARTADQFVLAVPGESMAEEALFLGTTSMAQCADKVSAASLRLTRSRNVAIPSLRDAVGNIECQVIERVDVYDHLLVVGRVRGYSLGTHSDEKPLLSIGPDEAAFRLVRSHGIHRLGVVR